MKFAIVLLGFLALSAAAPQERGTIDNIVGQAINNAQSELNKIVDQVRDLTSKIQGEADSILSVAQDKINSAIDELESQLNDLIAKGGVTAQCAKQNLQDLEAFKTIIGKNVPNCAANLSTSIADLLGSVSGDIISLKNAISELAPIVAKCAGGSDVEIAICAAANVGPIVSSVVTIASSASSAIKTTSAKAPELIDQVNTCSNQVVGEATITLNKFADAVKQCQQGL
ncbi:unnamed protein product [Hermetia illucens]|uniref:Protein TsetseEP domain-containing protein n=1 Tax=Hermetia illucens TaxID=343691 RepID=A0A7R8YSP0_HERIL|nr:uncharacterized protein LOC119651047 [Hermetia illucens]CAD7083836.1 unnamed protein product [Hermetia illucens]